MTNTDPRHLVSTFYKRRSANDAIKAAIPAWEVWNCDAEYRHDYDRAVSLHVAKGKAIVSFNDGQQVDLRPGDLLTISPGISATWTILAPIENNYIYHDVLQEGATPPFDL